MIKFQFYIYLLPLMLSAVLSIKTFTQKWPQPYRAFSILVMCTFLVEAGALWWNLSLHKTAWWSYNRTNLWLYNFYLLPQYLLYFFFFKQVLRNVKTKRGITVLSSVYLLFALVNYLFIQGPHQTNSYTMILAYTSVIVLGILFFNQVSSDTEAVIISKSPAIWITAGMFIFHLCSLPSFIFTNYLNTANLSLSLSLFFVVQFFNIIMYSFYSIAFLCKPPIPK